MEQPLFKVETQQYRFIAKSIKLSAFRGFQNEVVIPLEPDLTVFIAQNGGGKTTVLDALDEHLQILADATFQLEGHLASLRGKDVNLNVDTFSELSADFSLDYMAYEVDINEEGQTEGKYVEYLGIPIQTFFFINKEGGIIEVEKIEPIGENHLEKIQNFNNFKPGLRNFPVFKYYRPGEQGIKTTKRDFENITAWIERAQKIAYQEGNNSKNEAKLNWLNDAISYVLNDIDNEENESYKYSDFRVKYTDRGDVLEITKQHTQSPDKYTFSIDQLSSGERALIGTVADLAIELIEKNPNGQNPLEEGFAIVLIDEIDVHLHVEWQVSIVQKLCKIFSNVQFIIATHSPEVIKTIQREKIRIIRDWKIWSETPHTLGRDTNSILSEVFLVDDRLKVYEDKISLFYQEVETNLDNARSILEELKMDLGPDDEAIMKAESYLEMIAD